MDLILQYLLLILFHRTYSDLINLISVLREKERFTRTPSIDDIALNIDILSIMNHA